MNEEKNFDNKNSVNHRIFCELSEHQIIDVL